MIENQDKIKLANAVKSSLYDIQKVESTSNFKYSRISKKKEKYDYKTIVFILFLIILIIIAGRSSILIFGGLVIFLAIYIISLLRHELQL
ncbi:MAG: hypothetical protein OEY49_17210 [Candidatus Heimdallarchaeota archaeon]|nr:hypothetical protein [Candidatus Heimdallarchaeota archaeon]